MAESAFEVTVVEDKPASGMWHYGPNACWVTVTHKRTRQSVTVYDGIQYRARERAMMLLELALQDTNESLGHDCKPLFPEKMQ